MSKAPKPSSTQPATAIYTRISLDREHTQLGVERQAKLCRELCAAKGWDLLPGTYSDPSTSALQRKHRPGFAKLVEAIKAGEVKRVVAWHPDRLTRNMAELETIIALLDAHDVMVETVQAGTWDLSNASGRMTARILGAVATQESEHKGERVSAKHRELAAAGKRAGGPRPFGYLDAACRLTVEDGDSDELVAKAAAERTTIAEAIDRVLAGQSLRSICADFNARGLTTTRGGPWQNVHLRGKLMSGHIAGIRTYHGEEFEGAWQPIVDRAKWRRAVTLLSAPERSRRAPAVPYVLHGLVVTPEGAPLVGKIANGSRWYIGPGATAPEADLDLIVTRAVFAYLADGLSADTDPSEGERDRLTAECGRLQANIKRLNDKAAKGLLPFDQWEAMTDPMREQVRDLELAIEHLAPMDASMAALVARPGALEASWDELPTAAKREALRLVLRAVVVKPSAMRGKDARLINHPERVTYQWRLGKAKGKAKAR